MRHVSMRVFRIFIVGGGAWLAYVLLSPHGLGWLVIPLAIVATLGISLGRYVRLRRGALQAGREEQWAAATLDSSQRPRAIEEVRAALSALGPIDDQSRSDHVRLSVLLAELLGAEGQREDGEAVLDAIDSTTLGPIDGAVLRHGRAVMLLRHGDAKGVLQILGGRPLRTGAPALDLRLELLEASAQLEEGEAETAMSTATSVRRRAAADQALVVEARVVRAAALDALGNRPDALKVLRSLGPDMLDMLEVLGQPRVRTLARDAKGDE